MALFGGILCLGVLPFLMVSLGESCGLGRSLIRQVLFWFLVRDFFVLT